MSKSIAIDPVTRLEGHLAVQLAVENGRVASAKVCGEMFRGFETILRGRDPMDAQQIVQRICGVCPISHGTASILAQDQAYGVTPPPNGRLLRNLIQGANYLQSHIVHFYQLAALDFIDITAVLNYEGRDQALLELKAWVRHQLDSKSAFPAAPFLPRYEAAYIDDPALNIDGIKHYLQALQMRRKAHQAAALFCAKIPHATGLIPGGVTQVVDARQLAAYRSLLHELGSFIESAYIPDVLGVAKALPQYFGVGKGCGNFLAYGVFKEEDQGGRTTFPAGVIRQGVLEPFDVSEIAEHVRFSFFQEGAPLHPARGVTNPAPEKSGEAYSWLKAPRYRGQPMEVGPLARVLIAYRSGAVPELNRDVDQLLAACNIGVEALDSVLGRHAARALEARVVLRRCEAWLDRVELAQRSCADFKITENGTGAGLWEAPRGALGHWLEIEGYKVKNYQCVVPSTWNCSPRDQAGVAGPIEQALVGTPIADSANPIEAARVVRAFDPCLACAVH